MVFVIRWVLGVPPLPLNTVTWRSVQWAHSVRAVAAVALSVPFTWVPPSSAVNQPWNTCPERFGSGRVPYALPIVFVSRCTSGDPPFPLNVTTCLSVH